MNQCVSNFILYPLSFFLKPPMAPNGIHQAYTAAKIVRLNLYMPMAMRQKTKGRKQNPPRCTIPSSPQAIRCLINKVRPPIPHCFLRSIESRPHSSQYQRLWLPFRTTCLICRSATRAHKVAHVSALCELPSPDVPLL